MEPGDDQSLVQTHTFREKLPRVLNFDFMNFFFKRGSHTGYIEYRFPKFIHEN